MPTLLPPNSLRQSLAVALCLFLSIARAQADYDTAPFLRWVETSLAVEGIPGSAVAIVTPDKVLHLQTWGKRKADANALVTSEFSVPNRFNVQDFRWRRGHAGRR